MKPFSRRCGTLLLAAFAGVTQAQAQGTVVRLPARDRVLSGTPQAVWAVGRADGAEWETLSDAGKLAFDGRDNLYVLERMTARVLVFDASGRFVRQVERKGHGPGEFTAPMEMAVAGDGTLLVWDFGRGVVAVFGPDGTFIRDVRLEGLTSSDRTGMAWHPRGGFIASFREVERPTGREGFGRPRRYTYERPLLFHPVDGGGPVRFYEVPPAMPPQQVQPERTGERSFRYVTPMVPVFTPPLLFDVLPEGEVAVAFTPGYTVRILDRDGQTVRYLQRPIRARRVTEADRRAERQRRSQTMGFNALDPETRERILNPSFADTMPALAELRASAAGTLWIQRTAPPGRTEGPIDLVTSDGRYLGTLRGVRMPEAISRSGLAAWTERDENDVPRIVVKRLPAGWR